MKDYTTLQNNIKEVDRKILGKVSPPLIPVLPDPSKREENLKAIVDAILCMVPGAMVLSIENINGLAPDVKKRQAVSRQSKKTDQQLSFDFWDSSASQLRGGI